MSLASHSVMTMCLSVDLAEMLLGVLVELLSCFFIHSGKLRAILSSNSLFTTVPLSTLFMIVCCTRKRPIGLFLSPCLLLTLDYISTSRFLIHLIAY